MAKSAPTLLLDGDIFLYRTTAACEQPFYDTELHVGYTFCKLEDCMLMLSDMVEAVKKELKSPNVLFCLSDRVNFRKTVLPSYKEARKTVRKPLCYTELKEWAMTQYPYACWPTLEADDVLGILATTPKRFMTDADLIVVSEDKDLKTVPCTLYRQGKLETISAEMADYNFLMQTLMGDATDGYKGCPGIGEKTAEKVLANTAKTPWENVVAAYEKAGLTEDDALVQARCARILRNTDYDLEAKQLKLWVPPKKVEMA